MKFRKAVSAAVTVAVLATSAMSASAHELGKGGGDILVLDIVDSAVDARSPAGGGDGDILVFDIVDSAVDAR